MIQSVHIACWYVLILAIPLHLKFNTIWSQLEPPPVLTSKAQKLPELHFSPKLQVGTLKWYHSMVLEPI